MKNYCSLLTMSCLIILSAYGCSKSRWSAANYPHPLGDGSKYYVYVDESNLDGRWHEIGIPYLIAYCSDSLNLEDSLRIVGTYRGFNSPNIVGKDSITFLAFDDSCVTLAFCDLKAGYNPDTLFWLCSEPYYTELKHGFNSYECDLEHSIFAFSRKDTVNRCWNTVISQIMPDQTIKEKNEIQFTIYPKLSHDHSRILIAMSDYSNSDRQLGEGFVIYDIATMDFERIYTPGREVVAPDQWAANKPIYYLSSNLFEPKNVWAYDSSSGHRQLTEIDSAYTVEALKLQENELYYFFRPRLEAWTELSVDSLSLDDGWPRIH